VSERGREKRAKRRGGRARQRRDREKERRAAEGRGGRRWRLSEAKE